MMIDTKKIYSALYNAADHIADDLATDGYSTLNETFIDICDCLDMLTGMDESYHFLADRNSAIQANAKGIQ